MEGGGERNISKEETEWYGWVWRVSIFLLLWISFASSLYHIYPHPFLFATPFLWAAAATISAVAVSFDVWTNSQQRASTWKASNLHSLPTWHQRKENRQIIPDVKLDKFSKAFFFCFVLQIYLFYKKNPFIVLALKKIEKKNTEKI